MKEVKYILYTLAIAAYTSLIWATIIWDGIQIGPSSIAIGLMLSIGCTICFLVWIITYLKSHLE